MDGLADMLWNFVQALPHFGVTDFVFFFLFLPLTIPQQCEPLSFNSEGY